MNELEIKSMNQLENRGKLPPEKAEKNIGYHEINICFLKNGTELLSSHAQLSDTDKAAIERIKRDIRNKKIDSILDEYLCNYPQKNHDYFIEYSHSKNTDKNTENKPEKWRFTFSDFVNLFVSGAFIMMIISALK